MPETPDFEQIARRLSRAAGVSEHAHVESVVEMELRGIWNARGAADLSQLETARASPSMKVIDQIIRTLDR